MKLPSFIRLSAIKYPKKVGLIIDDIQYTYEQVSRTCSGLASYFREKGVREGDKVATMLHNSIEQIYCYFALLKLGAVVVPINFRFAGPEISYVVNHSDAKALIYGREFQEIIDRVKGNFKKINFFIMLGKEKNNGGCEFEASTIKEATSLEETDSEIFNECFILYTSGTTGRPKGCIITHYNFIWTGINIIMDTFLTHDGISIVPGPLFHVSAMARLMATMMAGATFITWKKFDAEKVMKAIDQHKATFISLVPAMVRMIFMLQDIEKFNVSSVRGFLISAANVPVNMKERALKIFSNAQILDSYGLTEMTGPVTILNRPGDIFRKTGSVGLENMFSEVKIVDENFEEVGANAVGEIAVRGPNMTKGYYKDPEATDETIKNGWLLSGDLGWKDDDGYLYIVDRKKDMIISGGENIYSSEIETVLNSHPKVSDCAVIGVPDPKWGEAVMALIVLKRGEKASQAEIENYCIGRIARYKRPRIIKFVGSLIRNESGKVMKKELRGIYGMK